MNVILKILLGISILFVLSIGGIILYHAVDTTYTWFHEYQTIELDDEKRVRIYNNNLEDVSAFYLTIEENQVILLNKKFLWIGGIPSFSLVHSPSYEVIGVIKYDQSPHEIIALFDFETREFWLAENNEHNDEKLGQKLFDKLSSYPQKPFTLYAPQE